MGAVGKTMKELEQEMAQLPSDAPAPLTVGQARALIGSVRYLLKALREEIVARTNDVLRGRF